MQNKLICLFEQLLPLKERLSLEEALSDGYRGVRKVLEKSELLSFSENSEKFLSFWLLKKEIKLDEQGLGFDYVFKRLPTVSWYQVGLFLMSNWLFFCAGFTQVGSVILQANEDDYRCRSAPDTKFGFNFRSGLKHKSSND